MNEALECGIIDFDSVQQKIENMERYKILAEHQFNIYQGDVHSNGKTYQRWITYVIKDGKRHQIKRKTREEIEDYLVEFYKNEANKTNIINTIPSFKEYYNVWLNFKEKVVSDNTVYKYLYDYKRFFENTEFEDMKIKDIDDQIIIVFLAESVKSHKLTQKALKALCSYINEIFELAMCDKIIQDNPYKYVKPKLKLITKQCTKNKSTTVEDRTISSEDIHKLLERFKKDYITKPEIITPYAVEFAIYTGCRVGEIAALRWNDIDNNSGVITIRRSEKAHRVIGQNVTYTIEGTKTGKERKIPITKQLSDLLNRVSNAEEAINCKNEFVFADKNGRIKASNISRCMSRKCKQVGIQHKCIHSCRRTINSVLKNVGANTFMAASLLGHTQEVNDNYYTYDVSNLELKKELLEKANQVLTN